MTPLPKRKQTSVDRETCVFVSASFVFECIRQRRVSSNIVSETHETIFRLAPRYLSLPMSSNALVRRSNRTLDFLKFFLKHSQTHEKRKEDRFLCQLRHYDIVCSENIARSNRDSLTTSLKLYRIRTQSCTLQKRRCLAVVIIV